MPKFQITCEGDSFTLQSDKRFTARGMPESLLTCRPRDMSTKKTKAKFNCRAEQQLCSLPFHYVDFFKKGVCSSRSVFQTVC